MRPHGTRQQGTRQQGTRQQGTRQQGAIGRSAYTLLEVLIVTALLTAIFAGIWTMLRSWSGIYEDGQRRTAESQLVRSLIEQFQDDLHAIAYTAAPARGRRSSRSSRRRVSLSSVEAMAVTLVGGSDWLVMDVLQPPSPFHPAMSWQTSGGDDASVDDTNRQSASFAPELMRVVYTFEPPPEDPLDGQGSAALPGFGDDTELVGSGSLLEDEGELVEPFSGLLRVATYREKFAGISSGESATERQSGRKGSWRQVAFRLREIATGAESIDPGATDELAVSVEPAGDGSFDARPERLEGIAEQDEMPEVNSLQIRYYDGSSWRTAWDSSRTGELPVAVELRFEVDIPDPDALSKPGASSDLGVEGALVTDDSMSLDSSFDTSLDEAPLVDEPFDGAAAGGQQTEETPYHRCIVYLHPPKGKSLLP